MANALNIKIDDKIAELREPLDEFIRAMTFKLIRNSHKQTPQKVELLSIIDRAREELAEFEAQVSLDKFDENSLLELADAANFCLLAYVVIRNEKEHLNTSGYDAAS